MYIVLIPYHKVTYTYSVTLLQKVVKLKVDCFECLGISV